MTRKRTPNHPPLRDRLLQHLRDLRIPLEEESLDQRLRVADGEKCSPLAFAESLLGDLAAARRERSAERRIRLARFPERKSLEEFDWDFNKKTVDRAQFEELATADFVRRRDNLILVGQSGLGKSHLIQALGIRACVSGCSVRYCTSAHLIRELNAALADRSLDKALRPYIRPQLLIVDEFGLDRLERLECPDAASFLYQVVNARYRKSSTALITNIDFDQWGEYLGDAPLSMALLDRLVDHAILLKLTGRSYRAARARKRGKTTAAKTAGN